MMEELLGVATPDKDASWLVLTALGYIISMVIAVLTVLVLVKKNSAKYATVREHDQLRKELKAVERDVRAGDEKILSAIDKSTAMMQERLDAKAATMLERLDSYSTAARQSRANIWDKLNPLGERVAKVEAQAEKLSCAVFEE